MSVEDTQDRQVPRRPSEPGPVEAKAMFRALLAQRVALIVGGIFLTVVLVLLVVLVFEVRNTQLEGTPTGRQLLASSDRILDCTDPGDATAGKPPGKCFSDAQARTAEAVGSITDNSLRVSAAIAYCQSRGVHDYKPLLKCAVRLVSPRNPKP